MKRGGGGKKGGSFERRICVLLSLWVTAGKSRDAFWRSAISGGRATVAARRGIDLANQAGDIVAVAPEGHALTQQFFIECKHYKRLGIDRFILEGTGKLAAFWRKAVKQAIQHKRTPLMIAKQNGFPIIIVVPARRLREQFAPAEPVASRENCDLYLFEAVLHERFKRRASRRVML